SSGNFVASAITNSAGAYAFTHVPAGMYEVEVVPPTNYTLTLQDQGTNDAIDSDPNPSTHRTAPFALGPNEYKKDIDAGLVYSGPTGSIGDYVWYDLNENGIQNYWEPGAAGVTVRLYGVSGNLLATTVTIAGGFYSFNLLPGGTYQIEVIPPPGYVLSPKDA